MSIEQHKPTPREAEIIEEVMTPEMRAMSEDREIVQKISEERQKEIRALIEGGAELKRGSYSRASTARDGWQNPSISYYTVLTPDGKKIDINEDEYKYASEYASEHASSIASKIKEAGENMTPRQEVMSAEREYLQEIGKERLEEIRALMESGAGIQIFERFGWSGRTATYTINGKGVSEKEFKYATAVKKELNKDVTQTSPRKIQGRARREKPTNDKQEYIEVEEANSESIPPTPETKAEVSKPVSEGGKPADEDRLQALRDRFKK
jgi:hypothetical protein